MGSGQLLFTPITQFGSISFQGQGEWCSPSDCNSASSSGQATHYCTYSNTLAACSGVSLLMKPYNHQSVSMTTKLLLVIFQFIHQYACNILFVYAVALLRYLEQRSKLWTFITSLQIMGSFIKKQHHIEHFLLIPPVLAVKSMPSSVTYSYYPWSNGTCSLVAHG